ncbi:MAG: hypothetical protein LBU90_08210 [Bacteroidales bacterium]|jgi:hypothetical protein|nr:hypothetical protein [Bacteroidales bacterium]
MKTKKISGILALIVSAVFACTFTACENNDPDTATTAQKSELQTLIDQVKSDISGATGLDISQVPDDVMNGVNTALTDAQNVVNKANATKTEVLSVKTALQAALSLLTSAAGGTSTSSSGSN